MKKESISYSTTGLNSLEFDSISCALEEKKDNISIPLMYNQSER